MEKLLCEGVFLGLGFPAGCYCTTIAVFLSLSLKSIVSRHEPSLLRHTCVFVLRTFLGREIIPITAQRKGRSRETRTQERGSQIMHDLEILSGLLVARARRILAQTEGDRPAGRQAGRLARTH